MNAAMRGTARSFRDVRAPKYHAAFDR